MKPSYVIQKIQNESEKQDAFQVRRIVFIDEQQVPEEIELDEHDESHAETIHFIAYKEKEPVAASRLRPYAPLVGKIERVAVLATERGTGLGKQVMQKMEETAISEGFTKLKLNAQYQAKAFYEKLGYTQSGELFVEAGIDHIPMEKDLT